MATRTPELPLEPEERIRILEASLARLLEWIGSVDVRIQVVLAVDIAMIGALAAKAPLPSELGTDAGRTFILATAVLLVSAAMTYPAIVPRLLGPKDSLVYFGGIASLEEKTFQERSRSMTTTSYASDLERQCYRNAQIAQRKFLWLRRSMQTLLLALPFWLIAMFLLYQGA